jgi:hypothetical protein
VLIEPTTALEAVVNFGVDAFGASDVALEANRFWKEADGVAGVTFAAKTPGEVAVVDFAGEEAPGRLAKALARGALSFAVSGNAAIFLSGLLLLADFDGLSSIFLKIFEVDEPNELDSNVPFVTGVFTGRSGFRCIVSLVICSLALRFSGVSEDESLEDVACNA